MGEHYPGVQYHIGIADSSATANHRVKALQAKFGDQLKGLNTLRVEPVDFQGKRGFKISLCGQSSAPLRKDMQVYLEGIECGAGNGSASVQTGKILLPKSGNLKNPNGPSQSRRGRRWYW
jgi:hypothetical protein